MTPSTSRRYLESLARNGQLTAAGLDGALRQIGVFPDAASWRQFADRLLLAAGSLLLLAGVVFFFAFNWNDLHRFVKMALVALPLMLSTSVAARLGIDGLVGKAWLGAAVVLTGVLLAVIGQIYQTGADSELLFAGWAVLALPWVMVACAPWLWLFWLVLANTALALFMFGRLDIWTIFLFFDAIFWGPLLFNALALLLWELLWSRSDWMRVAYAPRFIALLAAAAATGLGVSWWFIGQQGNWRLMHYVPCVYLPWLFMMLWFYRQRRRDIVPLATAALSAIAVLTAGLIEGLFDNRHFDVAAFFIVGAAVAAMTAGAAVWLRHTVSQWKG
ncbi:DUF2157 domain-containing protein [Propionivibrio sp.]|uniref:DUF2157 domain-containing protein n=1 Tax=Propionivibrio sp. TaxID=2212460 RepID=UPI003BF2BA1C